MDGLKREYANLCSHNPCRPYRYSTKIFSSISAIRDYHTGHHAEMNFASLLSPLRSFTPLQLPSNAILLNKRIYKIKRMIIIWKQKFAMQKLCLEKFVLEFLDSCIDPRDWQDTKSFLQKPKRYRTWTENWRSCPKTNFVVVCIGRKKRFKSVPE